MNNLEAAGFKGFVKRASEYGVSQHEATKLFKQAGVLDWIKHLFSGGGSGGMMSPTPTPTPMPQLGAIGNNLGQNLDAKNQMIKDMMNQ